MNRWLVAWVSWGVVFLVIEITASLNHVSGATLSEQVWRWIGIGRDMTVWLLVRRSVFILFWIWVTLHFLGIQFFEGTGI